MESAGPGRDISEGGDIMTVMYAEPMTRAWRRMKQALFAPFDAHKWFVIGFNAFLAGLADWNRGSGGSRGGGRFDAGDVFGFPHRAWTWLMAHPGWFAGILFLAFLVFVVATVILWLSSRGVFMFLDNVVRDAAEIAAPWKRFRREGDSLFLWRFAFGFIGFAFFLVFALGVFSSGARIYEQTRFNPLPVLWIAASAAGFLLLVTMLSYISLLAKDFVAPIMYKDGLSATKAWGVFLRLFGRHPAAFIVYGLLVFVLIIIFVIVVVIAGLVTCCIGWLLLVIPYIGTVITLPVWYALRAFSLEFLAQFGPEYSLFGVGPNHHVDNK
jgi:hypothetical protein